MPGSWEGCPTVGRHDELELLKRLFESDPLCQPSDSEKRMLYKYRHRYKNDPRALPKLMLAVRSASA